MGSHANVLQLRAFAEPGGSVHAALLVQSHPAGTMCEPRGSSSAGAGRCSLTDQNLPSDGFLVYDTFSGNLTDFHPWDRALSPAQVRQACACAQSPGGLLFQEDPEALNFMSLLLLAMRVCLLCPGRAEEPELQTKLWEELHVCGQAGPGGALISRCLAVYHGGEAGKAGVPTSKWTTIHKNLTLSLTSAEGFLMTSEWEKANKVGSQLVACVTVTAAMNLLFLAAFPWLPMEQGGSCEHAPRPQDEDAAVQPHDCMTSGHYWLRAHTDDIWAFVGPMLFVLMVNSEVWVPQGRDISGRGDFSCPLAPNLQDSTCILVCVVMVTASSAHRRACVLSPQPGLQQKIRFWIWALVKPVLALPPVLGLT
ncbi:hypothetical protein ACRRTK_024662 [Alexandromys fortis]